MGIMSADYVQVIGISKACPDENQDSYYLKIQTDNKNVIGDKT